MRSRTSRISAAIAGAVSEAPDDESHENSTSCCGMGIRPISNFFTVFHSHLVRYRLQDFVAIRHEIWKIDDGDYAASFCHSRGNTTRSRHPQRHEADLIPVGDLGYSGSTFLITGNGKYLVKSLDRRFEHDFFMNELFEPYLVHMETYMNSLLVRITDTLYVPETTVGGLLGITPTHHIIMENLMYGKEHETSDSAKAQWTTYDLKPDNYFFPERDIADGNLASESVKNKLADKMPDRLRVSSDLQKELLHILDTDTEFLARSNVVDYSLFLVRYPGPGSHTEATNNSPSKSTSKGIEHDAWRTGVASVDGKWSYRVVLLDFFWARHKFQPKVMSGLVGAFNLVAKKGPMTITADPVEYKGRFMDMVKKLVSDRNNSEGEATS